MMPADNRGVQEVSAGGIVFFGNAVLVLENHRGDLVFPKGHLEVGESAEEAAIREVSEEAGIRPRIVCPLGTTEYRYFWVRDGQYRNKTVHWFLMEAPDATIAVDGNEIRAGSYMDPEEAARALTYKLDKEKLAVAVLRRRELPYQ